MASGSRCLCNWWPMLSAHLSNQASSKLILTPSRHPPRPHWWLPLWATIPSGSSAAGTQTRSPAYPSPTRHSYQLKRGDRVTRITASAALIISFFNEWEVGAGRPGRTATQVKSDYPGTVCFSFKLPISLILFFFFLLNNFPAWESRDICFWYLFLLQILFLLYFAHVVAASQGAVVTLLSLKMNYLKHNQLKFFVRKMRDVFSAKATLAISTFVFPGRCVLSSMFTAINRKRLIILQLLFCYCSALIWHSFHVWWNI